MPESSTLAKLIQGLGAGEGIRPSRLPQVRLMRSSCNWPAAHVTYEPSIVIVAQGKKRGRIGSDSFIYDADNYLVLAVPLPFECDTEGSVEEPMLGLSVKVSPPVIAELVMEMRELPPITEPQTLAVRSYPMDAQIASTAIRLARILYSEDDARILGAGLVRELTYLVLRREKSGTLRSLAAPHSHFGQIARALQRMNMDYATPIDMNTLAGEAGMSVSTFHTHFKAVTSSPPLQYLKSIRLQRARTLMVQSGATAGEAAREVGYESASQFSREFKRYFGGTPAETAQKMRDSMAVF